MSRRDLSPAPVQGELASVLNSASIHNSHQTPLHSSHTQHLTLQVRDSTPQDRGEQESSLKAPDLWHQACKQLVEFWSTLHSIVPRSVRAIFSLGKFENSFGGNALPLKRILIVQILEQRKYFFNSASGMCQRRRKFLGVKKAWGMVV